MARIDGTEGSDELNGTAENDEIYGYGGHDLLLWRRRRRLARGRGRGDYLSGGAGKDRRQLRDQHQRRRDRGPRRPDFGAATPRATSS